MIVFQVKGQSVVCEGYTESLEGYGCSLGVNIDVKLYKNHNNSQHITWTIQHNEPNAS